MKLFWTLVGAFVLLTPVRQHAQSYSACSPLSEGTKKRLEKYLDDLTRASNDGNAPAASNSIVSATDINGSCYKKLLIHRDNTNIERVLFLTPDQRFLSVALSDSLLDPDLMRKQTTSDLEKRLESGSSPAVGRSNALIKIVVFEDFECPYCKRLDHWMQELPQNIREKVKVEYKSLPLKNHPWARQAAAIALCENEEGSAQYLQFRNFIFLKQDDINYQNFFQIITDDSIGGTHLNADFIKQCLSSPKIESLLSRDQQLAAELRITHTPTVFANGQLVLHLSSAEDLDRALAKILLLKSEKN